MAASGHGVICVDISPEIVSQINDGKAPIFEKGLQVILRDAVTNGRLKATTDVRAAVLDTDVSLICVGTPNDSAGMDLTQIISAAEEIGKALREKATYHVVVVRSTVLPGTTEGIIKSAIEAESGRKLGKHWGLCVNPEFLREGNAIEDFLSPDRVVIGASDERAAQTLAKMYRHNDCPKLITSMKTAEMIKYVANSLFATLISFSNEMANICAEISGVDAREVWMGVHPDRRLTLPGGQQAGLVEYLWHGLGFGGSCFPKDVAALRGLANQLGSTTPILNAVLQTNEIQPLRVVQLLEQEMEVPGRTVAILGLAFKPGTDDLRESPAIRVVEALEQRGAHVVVHDPVAMPKARRLPAFRRVRFAPNWSTALRDSDACCLITSWNDYKAIRPRDFVALMKRPFVIDGRGMFDRVRLENAGIIWRGIGYVHEKQKARRRGPVKNAICERHPQEAI